MRTSLLLAGALATVVASSPGHAQTDTQAAETAALAAALGHARSVVPEGRILVVDETRADSTSVRKAAHEVQYEYGPLEVAVDIEHGPLRVVGGFRGVVYVDSLHVASGSASITLRVISFNADGTGVYEQVDEVVLVRNRRWEIARVIRVSET